MKSKSFIYKKNKLVLAVLVAVLFCIPAILSGASQQSGDQATVAQKGFAKPKEAAEALIKAAENFDVPALLEILGPDGEDLVSSEDPVTDKNNALAFAAMAREKQSVSKDPYDKNRYILSAGNQDWPLPIPIVKRSGKWYFDSKAGHDEVLCRRIGTNELNAIEVCRGFVEAQVHCLDAATGAIVWTHGTEAPIWGCLLAANDRLYVGNTDGVMTVLRTGRRKKELARIEMGAPLYSRPALAGDTLYLATADRLYMIGAKP